MVELALRGALLPAQHAFVQREGAPYRGLTAIRRTPVSHPKPGRAQVPSKRRRHPPWVSFFWISKIGRNTARTMPPTRNPMKPIRSGSIIEVRLLTLEDTCSS